MKKVSPKLIKALLNEQRELLVKYADDEIAVKEIKYDIDAIYTMCRILAVRDLIIKHKK